MKFHFLWLVFVIAMIAASGCGTAPKTTLQATATVQSAKADTSASLEQSATTTTYKLALAIAPPEKMLTVEEAKTAKEGEVMVGGEMAMSTPDKPMTHHLEVSVTDQKSGALITEQSVAIAVANVTTRQVTNIPIAKMYGLDAGVSETHFGNNVALAAGSYTIVVTVGGEAATFQVTIPTL